MSEATKLDSLVALLSVAPDEVFIQTHNVPDPDAIASAAGMRLANSVSTMGGEDWALLVDAFLRHRTISFVEATGST